jgi:hypothetical protein
MHLKHPDRRGKGARVVRLQAFRPLIHESAIDLIPLRDRVVSAIAVVGTSETTVTTGAA